MFRWPIELTPLSVGGRGVAQSATLEVTPRGATFTLAALGHVGHPAHLALIDAYLKGQVRATPTSSIGEDSRLVAASLAAPLIAAFELGIERLALADLILLPRDLAATTDADRATGGLPTHSPDSARFLLRCGEGWQKVRTAERFEDPGCLGTRRVGHVDSWHHVVAELTAGTAADARDPAGQSPGRLIAEVREPSSPDAALPSSTLPGLREEALSRFARSRSLANRAQVHRVRERWQRIGQSDGPDGLSVGPAEAVARSTHGDAASPSALPGATLGDILAGLAEPIAARRSVVRSFLRNDLTIQVSLEPDADGYLTLCLLPAPNADPTELFEPMREVAWETVEALIGRPLAERRTEPIALRLLADDGHSATLDVGASVVIVRNQSVFTAWVGTDGRVMMKLFPPGGMVVR